MNTPRQFSSVSPAHDKRNTSDEKSSMTHTVDPPEFPESLKIRNRENFFDAHNASDLSPDVFPIAVFILSQSIDACIVSRQNYFFSLLAAAAFFCSAGAASVVSSRTGIPSARFTSHSMRFITSGLSFKVCFEFSRPWPRRSPLYENHAPLFSTTRLFEARSSRSPSREMPSPYMMSNSASRNGGATLFLATFTLVRLPTTRSPSLIAPMRRMSRRKDE